MATTVYDQTAPRPDDTPSARADHAARVSWVASMLLDMEMSPSRLDLCPRYEAELMDAMAALCRVEDESVRIIREASA